MKILIVDDHPMVLHGLAGMLAARGHEIRTAADLPQARTALEREGPFELLVLDFHLPSGTGLDVIAHAGEPKPLAVLLSGVSEPEDVIAALEHGVTAFIPKNVEPEDLVAALEQLPALPAALASGCVWDTPRRAFLPVEAAFPKGRLLTPKERDVFMHLRRGLLDKQIADELGLSIHTVRVHIRAIKRKRGARRRAETQL